MPTDALRRVLSENNIYVQHMTPEKEACVIPNLNNSELNLTDRINRISENCSIREETAVENDSSIKVVIQRESIPPSLFNEVFSWKNVKTNTSNIIPRKEISYKRGIPQIDQQWARYSAQFIKSTQPYRSNKPLQSTYSSTAEYHTRAQILLNRFFIRNPYLRHKEFQAYHPELMLAALNVTLKVEGGVKIRHSDFRKILNSRLPKEDLYRVLEKKIQTSFPQPKKKDLHKAIEKNLYNMEVMFLEGIGWNASMKLSVKDEMRGLIFKHPMDQTKMHSFFNNKVVGCYVIQEAKDHYVVSIKTDEKTIKSHRFTFNKDNKLVKILDNPSPVTKKFEEREHLLDLIKEWGGKSLITRDIDQDLLNQSNRKISARDALKGKPKGSFVIEKENDIYVARIKSVALQGADDPAFIMRAIKFKILKDGRAKKGHDTFKNFGLVENNYITLAQKFGGTELIC